MSALPPPTTGHLPAPIDDAEVAALAERLDGVLRRNAGRRAMRDRVLAVARGEEAAEGPLPTAAEIVLDTPTRTLTWAVLAGHADTEPEAVARRWAELREEAAAELASGGRLARAAGDATPLQRARLLAVRDAFIGELGPRGGVEMALVDQAVMAYTGMLDWQERLGRLVAMTDGDELVVSQLKRALEYEERWGTSTERQERADDLYRYESLRAREAESARMVDRYQRMFMRALRQFRETRRLFASVHIHNRGQVNIGDRQVNVKE